MSSRSTWWKNSANGTFVNTDFCSSVWAQQNGATWDIHAHLPHNAWSGAISTGYANQAAAEAVIVRLVQPVDLADLA